MRSVPSSRYTSEKFAEREQIEVFARAWIAASRTQHLVNTGDYVTVDGAGPSVFVLRDKRGALRAFRNSCRHRGTRLLEGRGNVSAVRCPYHDWKYALDGRLRHVPGREGFDSLERDELGLLPVRVEEWAGFAWVNQDPHAKSLAESLGSLVDELAPYRLEEMVPIQEAVWTLPCNWKALLDNATESYHLEAVHNQSVQKHVDTEPDFKVYGDHHRLTLEIAGYEWRKWLDHRTARGGPYTDKQYAELHKYLLFPNFLINVLPYHLTVFQVFPDGVDRCKFVYGFYKRRGARGLEALRAYATWAASRWIWREDLAIIQQFQRGVMASDGGIHRLHDEEVAIAHFHAVLSRWLGEKPVQ